MLLMELSFPIKQQELRKKTRIKKSLKTALRKKRRSATLSAHTRWPKFRVWQKWVKNAHSFTKHELFIKKA